MSLVKTQVSKTKEAASGPLTPLVILPPKARACTPKRSQEEGNGNATARKRIEKAAGSSGYDLHGTPPGRGAGSPYCDPPMVQRPPQRGVRGLYFLVLHSGKPPGSPGLLSQTERTLLREKKEERKKEETRTHRNRAWKKLRGGREICSLAKAPGCRKKPSSAFYR